MKLLRVDLAKKQAVFQDTPQKYQDLGGRGLGAKILLEEVDASCDPLGKDNKLVFACGLLPYPQISSAGRLSAVSKSPLTGGIKESNAGGTFAHALARLGIQALVLEGKPADEGLCLLEVSSSSVSFVPCDHLAGKGNYDTANELLRSYGKSSSAVMIGPAGEMTLPAAAIVGTDITGDPSRAAARGGLGAVMGSKRVKAIVIKGTGSLHLDPKDPGAFEDALSRFHQALQTPFMVGPFLKMGTTSAVGAVDKFGAFPTRNFSTGSFEGVASISGDTVLSLVTARGGKGRFGLPCLAGCRIRCSSVIPDEKGEEIVRALEYETLGMLGSNLGIANLDDIALLNRLCNDYGLDTIETGAALGVAAEGGLLQFGDSDRAKQLVHEIGQGTDTGRLLGSGTAAVGRALNVKRVPCVKGQAMGAYDPRGMKALGVTYATTPQGADHTAGHPGFGGVDHHSAVGQTEISRKAQITRAGYDTIGICTFVIMGTGDSHSVIVDLLNAAHGTDFPPDYVEALGRGVLQVEREFNRRAGFTNQDDRLPEFFRQEKLPPYDLVFDISDEELDAVHQ